MNNLLFTELVIEYLKNEDVNIENEMIRRLKFCSFPDEVIKKIIGYEIKIINKRNLSFAKRLCNNTLWISKKDEYNKNPNFKLFPLLEKDYAAIDSHEIKETTLSLSEIISYYDEGYYIQFASQMPYSDIPESMTKEALKWTAETPNRQAPLKAIYSARFDLTYLMVYGKEADQFFHKLALRFFNNELQILNKYRWNSRYGDSFNIDNYDFEPYTSKYFDYYETK